MLTSDDAHDTTSAEFAVDRSTIGGRPHPGLRALAALAVGALAILVRIWAERGPSGRSDFAQLWVGARELLAGRDPYAAVGPGRLFEWHTSLVFPLPAVLLAVPFTALPLGAAEAAFAAASAGLLAWALTRDGWDALPWFVGFPVVYAMLRAQWSPLLTAAVLLPWLGGLVIAKPTIGAAIGLYRPSRAMVVGALVLVIASFLVLPDWPARWFAALHAPTVQNAHPREVVTTYAAPIAQPGGFVVLLALLRWRRPEARMLVALACVPQTLVVYEMVPVVLVAASRVEVLSLTVLSWGVWLTFLALQPFADWDAFIRTSSVAENLWLLMPATLLVLRRPNVRRRGCADPSPASTYSR